MPKLSFNESEARLISAIKEGILQFLKRPMANNDEGTVELAHEANDNIIYCKVNGYNFEIHIES